MNFRELLNREFPLTPVQLDQLSQHYELLKQWNKKMNLTRITSVEDVVHFHYCESLFLAAALPQGCLKIADVGTGAGFPGIPVAVSRAEFTVTLVESNKRKSVFLVEASRGLANTVVVPEAASEISGGYDWVVARAVRPQEVLSLTISKNFAILMSERELIDLPPPISVAKTPWGDHRVLAMFHVEHDRIDQTQSPST